MASPTVWGITKRKMIKWQRAAATCRGRFMQSSSPPYAPKKQSTQKQQMRQNSHTHKEEGKIYIYIYITGL
ncbi:hypothetical protein TRSC58_07334 [Trypanosoma rangeli SC58]|uniref:Uncharacterized protein n=1 Tax=Trypanosoma rangeli SC58 TaxID=429131 RepID=A0A061IS38_TRYRA|nr:hypothetical protein TRSC58_07334 [Trypanosoma rangeli SC58]